jgi:chromosomal replication initiator protein
VTLTAEDIAPAIILAFEDRLTVAKIQRAVAQFYGLQESIMTEPDRIGMREPRVSHPRQVAMFFSRKFTRLSFPEIGRRFGGRDHHTVFYAVHAVEARSARDPFLEIELEVLDERFAG